MQQAPAEILAEYGLTVPAGIEHMGRGLWLVRAGEDTLALREIRRRAAKVDFSLRALEHVIASGFPGIPAWRRDRCGMLAVRRGHSAWLLSEWVQGRGALLGLESDALAAAAALAELHLIATGLSQEDEPDSVGMYHRYLSRCRDRARSLGIYSVMAEHKLRRTALDREFLATVETVLPLAQATAERLEAGGWAQLAAESRELGVFAFRRVGQGGIVVTDGARPAAVLVDWGGCRRDCHLTDLARLVGRVIRGTGGDADLAQGVVAAYESVRPLTERERLLLPTMLAFPDRYFELARRYYEHKRDWPENTFLRHFRKAMQHLETQAACVHRLSGQREG